MVQAEHCPCAKPGLAQLQHLEPAKGRLSKIHPSLFVLRMKKLNYTQEEYIKLTTKPDLKVVLHLLFWSFAKWLD